MLRKLGHYLWRTWQYVTMFFFLPIGLFIWWYEPWFPPYGYIVAFLITVSYSMFLHDFIKRGWRFR